MFHLKTKAPTEYTGQELYVSQLLAEKDYSFFPLKKAMAIQGHATQKKDLVGLFARVEQLASTTKGIMGSLEENDDKVDKLMQMVEDLHASSRGGKARRAV
jgi:hypothetical protein